MDNSFGFKQGGTSAATNARLDALETTQLKILYYEQIDGTQTSGQISVPSGATIIFDQWENQVDAVVSDMAGNTPDYQETGIDVTALDSSGNYTLSGTLGTNPAAFIYWLLVPVKYLSNISTDYIIDQSVIFTTASADNVGDYILTTPYQTFNQIVRNDPTGFVDWHDVTLTGDKATYTISVSPKASSYILFSSGKYIEKTGTDSIIFPNVDGLHIIYFDSSGTLQHTYTFDTAKFFFGPDSLVSMFTWDTVAQDFIFKSIQNEMHGLMPGETHARLHYHDGMVITDGMGLSGFDVSEDGTSDACARWAQDSGWIADEDINPPVSAMTSTEESPIVYLSGSTPNWRNGTNTTGFNLLHNAGVLQYNELNAGSWSLSDVPDLYYVNYHVFVTSSVLDKHERFIVPGHAVYASKSEAIVKQLNEALFLANGIIIAPEFQLIGTILLRYDASYTNAAKAVIVPIGGGLSYNDFRDKNISNGTKNTTDLIIPVHLVRDVHTDSSINETDMEIDFDTTSGNLTATLKTIATLSRQDLRWTLKKITQDGNYVDIVLQTNSDSIGGSSHRTHRLSKMGDTIVVGITEHGKYYFESIQSASENMVEPAVATLTPSISGTDLTMNGDLLDLIGDASITCYFRYKEYGMPAWTNSSTTVKTAIGTYQIIETVTSGVDYEVQSVLEDVEGVLWYGDVKTTLSNYYSDIPSAQSDGLLRYWPLQETSGTDTTGVEKLGSGDDMACSNSVTISSDTINSNTIYKRVFASTAFMESIFQLDWTWTGTHISMLIQADVRTTSSDHTLFSCGRNIFSCAADNSSIQVNVDNAIQAWNSATPTGMINMFFIINQDDWYTRLFTVTSSAVTQRTTVWDNPDDKADYLRIARGTSGDGNHQDTEYLANGDIRSIAVWSRVLSNAEMMDIVDTLDNRGMLIV